MVPRRGLILLTVLAVCLATAFAQGDLHELARSGTLTQVQEAIAQGADVNAVDEDGLTPLLLAVWHNTPEVVEALLDAGADPQYKSPDDGYTIFRLANRNPDSGAMYALFQERQLSVSVGNTGVRGTPRPPPQPRPAAPPPPPEPEPVARNPERLTEQQAEAKGFFWRYTNLITRQNMPGRHGGRYLLDGVELLPDLFMTLCHRSARGLLKSPATADFDDGGIVSVTNRGIYQHFTHVDAQNSYGALIRSSVLCAGYVDREHALVMQVEIFD